MGCFSNKNDTGVEYPSSGFELRGIKKEVGIRRE
jgi:hypothetical protein